MLNLTYDMTGGLGQKMYAYAELNGTTGKTIPAQATSMTIDVEGDNSLNWLRAELKDNNGKTVYVDLSCIGRMEGISLAVQRLRWLQPGLRRSFNNID